MPLMYQEKGPFYVVKDHGQFAVMTEPEVEANQAVTLYSGPCDTRREAEQTLDRGLRDGSYKPMRLP